MSVVRAKTAGILSRRRSVEKDGGTEVNADLGTVKVPQSGHRRSGTEFGAVTMSHAHTDRTTFHMTPLRVRRTTHVFRPVHTNTMPVRPSFVCAMIVTAPDVYEEQLASALRRDGWKDRSLSTASRPPPPSQPRSSSGWQGLDLCRSSCGRSVARDERGLATNPTTGHLRQM